MKFYFINLFKLIFLSYSEFKMSRYKIEIDKEKCIGCGACSAIQADIFEMKEGKAYTKKSEITELEKGRAQDGVDACPVQAIKVIKK